MTTDRETVTRDDLESAIARLGLADKAIEIHVSLKSFPRVDGGPATLVDSFLSAGCTLVVPTFAAQTFSVAPPPDDRPSRNGIDYAAEDRRAAAVPPPGMRNIYDETRPETDTWLGATPAYVARRSDRVRCKLPVGDFSAVGPHARDLIAAETAADIYGPLRALAASDGMVLLMGVTLIRMTLLHLAEIEAGRRPFIRWALGTDGQPVRCMGGECSMGFDNLAEDLAPHETNAEVGASRWRLFHASEVLDTASSVIRQNPSITHCPDPTCIECADAIAGGPIDRPFSR
jgi:aminoglycoside 3-N-acetyltransferase